MLKDLNAEGRGLHELVNNIADKFTPELNKQLHFIATIRNKAVHEPEFNLDDEIEHFRASCKEAELELAKLVKTSKKVSGRKKKEKAPPPSNFNPLFLLPFFPGLNIFYFFFIFVLSILSGAKYISMLILYLFSFAAVAEGITIRNHLHVKIGAGLFVALYICGIFIPSRRFPKLRYIPLLNIGTVIANIKKRIHWKLFFIADILILLSITAVISVFIWNRLSAGIILFGAAYLGGIILFLYAGRKKASTAADNRSSVRR